MGLRQELTGTVVPTQALLARLEFRVSGATMGRIQWTQLSGAIGVVSLGPAVSCLSVHPSVPLISSRFPIRSR